jgi:phage terminase large subunit-like protein
LFRVFARDLWPEYVPSTPRVNWLWFHDLICDEIQALFEEADRRRAIVETIQALGLDPEEAGRRIRREITGSDTAEIEPLNLVIEIGPRSAKSSIVQRALVAWRWLTRPQEQFLTLACADKLVERDGIYLRDLIQGPPGRSKETKNTYQLIQAANDDKPWTLRQDQNAKSKFDTTSGGTRQGYSINSAYTGADADVRIVDDPHDIEDLMNRPPESIRRAADEVTATYRDKIQDRANNPIFVITILIMQRVAENDLAAYMLAHGARSVCLPTLFDPNHPRRHPKDPRKVAGEALDPIRKPREEMERRRKESEWWFEAKEQQNPSAPDGAGLTRANFSHRYAGRPEHILGTMDEVWITSDSATKGGPTNDFHGIHVVGRKGTLWHWFDRLTDRMDPTTYDQTMDGLYAKWGPLCRMARVPLMFLVEDTANGGHWLATRQGKIPKLYPFRASMTPGSDTSKPARWQYFIRAATAGQVLLPESAPWVDDLIGWWLVGLRGAHDDDADTASQLMVWHEVRGDIKSDPRSFYAFLG